MGGVRPICIADRACMGDSMTELYLIVHKVRGEPAFDIAEKMEVEDEVWWIVPTSGHRAYPSDYIPLPWLVTKAGESPLECMMMPDESTPEHYEVSAAPKGSEGSGLSAMALLTKLGLRKPIVRRV